MSIASKILLLPVIGATLLIVGCSSSSLSGKQVGEVGAEIEINIFDSLGSAFGTGIEPAPGVTKPIRAVAGITPDCTVGTTEICTIAATTLPCPFSGTFTISGTFTDTLNTPVANVDTIGLTGIELVPTKCTADDVVIVTGDPSITITGTGLLDDRTNNAIELPFTITQVGSVSFTRGSADKLNLPSSGHCDLNVTATFEQVPNTPSSPLQVQAAISGTLCGKTIPAGSIVQVGTF
jgi:hypothetical protein